MKTKNLVQAAILLALGLILHYISPPIFFGVKPDFLLATMFISLILNQNLQATIAIGLASGILSGMTSGMPGGQLANIIDKSITSIVFFLSLKYIIKNRLNFINLSLLTFVFTILSGSIFLLTIKTIGGLPQALNKMIIGIVLPTALANTFFSNLFYKLIKKIQVINNTIKA